MHLRRFLPFLISFAAVALLAACTPEKPKFRGTDVTGVPWGGDVALTTHTGERRKLSDFRGKIVVLFFGFSRCPDICSPTLAKLNAVMQQLGEQANAVQVVFITVDPKHDTVSTLATFVPKFNTNFVGMTGTAEEITAALREYKIVAEAVRQQPNVIAHSGNLMIKDREGRLRIILKNEAPVGDIAHDLSLLVRGA